jgi:hypothetical protein
MNREIRTEINTAIIAAEHKKSRERLQHVPEVDRRRNWSHENSSLALYEETFQGLLPPSVKSLPPGERLKSYIEEKFVTKKGEVVGVDLFGLGSKLFSGFSDNFFKKTAGVNYTDYRPLLTPDPTVEDERRNHTVIAGDVLRHSTKKNVEAWLDGDKIDVLFSRMEGAKGFLPKDPFSLGKEAQSWYRQTSDIGIIMSDVPNAFLNSLGPWMRSVEANFSEGLSVQGSLFEGIKLEKSSNSPKELPLLSIQQLKDIGEQGFPFSLEAKLFRRRDDM